MTEQHYIHAQDLMGKFEDLKIPAHFQLTKIGLSSYFILAYY